MGTSLTLAVGAGVSFISGALSLRLPWWFDEPWRERWHTRPTRVTGGLALLLGFLAASATAAVFGDADWRVGYLALAGGGAFVLGLCDDAHLIGARAKFIGQISIACATAAVVRPSWLPVAAAVPVGTFVLVAAMNSFNLLDNIDGLAAGTAAIAAATLALTTVIEGVQSVTGAACAVVGASVGFLPLNYRRSRPAALFMGDSGSHLLGLLVGSCALLAGPSGASSVSASVLAPLLILALPILDTSLVIVMRLVERRPIWRGGCDHLSHRLVYIGLGEREAVAALLLLAAMCGAAGLAVVAIDDALVTGAAVGGVVALLVGIGSRLALVREPHPVVALRRAGHGRGTAHVRRHGNHAHAN